MKEIIQNMKEVFSKIKSKDMELNGQTKLNMKVISKMTYFILLMISQAL